MAIVPAGDLITVTCPACGRQHEKYASVPLGICPACFGALLCVLNADVLAEQGFTMASFGIEVSAELAASIAAQMIENG